MKRERTSDDDHDGMYRNVFRHSAVSLWLQDLSKLRRLIESWRATGIDDLGRYLVDNPEAFREAVHAIDVIDVNDVTLAMYEVADRSALLGPLDRTLDLDDPEVIENLRDDILSVAIDRPYRERRSSSVSPSGKRLDIEIKVSIPPSSSPHQQMLVNVIDVTERNRLQRELDEERRSYHDLIDNLPDACFLKDREGRYVLANRAFAEMVAETDPSRLVGKTDRDYYPAELASRMADADAQVLGGGKYLEVEFERVDHRGELRWFLSAKAPRRDDDGTVTGLVGTIKDTTPRRNARRAMEESERRYRSIFLDAPLGIFQSTPDGKLLNANPAFARSIGYETPEELIEAVNKTGIASLYGDPMRRPTVSRETLTSEKWRRFQGPYRRKDGAAGVGRMMLRSYRPEGAPAPILEGFMEDITEQERVRKALESEHAKLQALMDSAPERIYFKDREGRFTLVNREAARALRCSDPNGAIGKHTRDIFGEDFAREATEDERRIMQTGEAMLDKEESTQRPDGTRQWLLTSKMPLIDESGNIIGTFGVSRDITLQKALEAQRIRTERLESLSQLASGIAHHFNNINGAIMGYLGVVSGTSGLPEKARRLVEEALEAARRSVEITSRLEILTSAVRVDSEALRMESVMQDLLPELENQTRGTSVRIQTALVPTKGVLCSRRSLEFALRCVLSNALHALLGRGPSRIAVASLEVDEYSGIEVSDTGCGIPEENKTRLFTPFFTTKGEWAKPGSVQAQVKGTGLSLAVCRTLLSAQGGKIEIDSAEDSGTTVRILLPKQP